MTRKFAWWGLSFLFGLILFNADMGESLEAFSIAVVCVGVLMIAALKKYRVYIFSVAVCILFGLFCGQLYTVFRYDKVTAYSGENVTVEGVITDCSYIGGDVCRITVKGRINGSTKTVVTYFAAADDFEYYEKVEVFGKVRLIENTLKFRSHDYYLSKGVFLEGEGMPEVQRIGEGSNPFMKAVMNFRDYTAECLSQYLDERQSGFLKAILCGDKSDVDGSVKTVFYRSGIGHLFAVSGTHLSIVTAFFSIITGSLISSKKIKIAVTEIIIVLFMCFAGFSPSVTRAGIMLSAVYSSDLFRRRADCLNSLGICCVVMGLANPYVVRDPAFILSFSAAFAAGAVYPGLASLTENFLCRRIVNALLVTTVIQVVTMPFAAALFSEISVAAVLSNVILVPICTFALVFALTAMLFGGTGAAAAIVFKASGFMAAAAMKISEFFASLSFAAVPGRYYKAILIFAAISLLGVFAALRFKRFRIYILSLLAVFGGLYSTVSFMRLTDSDKIHIIILPDGKNCTAVVYQGKSGGIIDLNSKGDMCYPLQQAMSSRGVYRLRGAFFTSGCYYSADVYKKEVYPEIEKCYNILDENGADTFVNGSYVSFSDTVISRTDNGYEVSNGFICVNIEKDKAFCGDLAVDFSDEKYPLEIIISGEDLEIRRLDYAFNQQQRFG